MTPWGYVNLVVEKLQLSRSTTFDQIYNYCIDNADRLDPGDEKKIVKLIKRTLESLCDDGRISKCGNRYTVKCNLSKVELTIFDDVPSMNKITRHTVEKMDQIDENTPYGKEPLIEQS